MDLSHGPKHLEHNLAHMGPLNLDSYLAFTKVRNMEAEAEDRLLEGLGAKPPEGIPYLLVFFFLIGR